MVVSRGRSLHDILLKRVLNTIYIYHLKADCKDVIDHLIHFRNVLREGGTAVDAAISALACNGAVHSHSMGLGGGFLMTIYKRSENRTYFLNARETAPRYTTEDMFVNSTVKIPWFCITIYHLFNQTLIIYILS